MIERLNERIVIQKNAVVVDQYANRRNTWTDYYSCACYADTFAKEEEGAVITEDKRTIIFEVRYCSTLREITSVGYRVLFHGDVYNIVSVDMMNWQRKVIKISCRKEER